MSYKYKYLRVRIQPDNTGRTVCRVNVTGWTTSARKQEWDRLDEKYPPDAYTSCYEQTNDVLPCWEEDITIAESLES